MKGIGALTLFVEDLDRARAFYLDVLGLRLVFEDETSAAFELGTTIVNLLLASEAHEVIAPLETGGPGSAPRAVYTVWADDVDARCNELRSRGVRFVNGPTDQPWGQRTACFTDPAGHVWELSQDMTGPAPWGMRAVRNCRVYRSAPRRQQRQEQGQAARRR